MSLLSVWVASASAWCESTIRVDSDGPYDSVAWPTASESVGPDTIVMVGHIGVGALGPVQILDPNGVDVPATRIDLTEQEAVFVPNAPLAAGDDYEVVVELPGFGLNTFDVVDLPAGEIAPTAYPVRRQVYADATFLDLACPEEAHTRREVDYRLCDRTGVLLVAVVGDTEPPVPSSIADLGPFDALGGGEGITVASDALTPGAATTVWIGAFDGNGRFGGWVPDILTLPETGTVRFEEPEDDGYGATTTPTAFDECPAEAVTWVTTFEQTCASWTQTGLECNDDVVDDEEPSEDVNCSCATGPAGAVGGAGLLTLLFVGRRRR